MRISRILASALLVLSITSNLCGDDLPRHGVIGLVLAAKDPTHAESVKANPPTVQIVMPGGAGDAAGFKTGDIVRGLDGTPITSSADFAVRIGRHLAIITPVSPEE
jgi:S1-C subfamily serine protease